MGLATGPIISLPYLLRAEMTESYTKALRDKRDLDRRMKVIHNEYKSALYVTRMEKKDVEGGLLVSFYLIGLAFTGYRPP